MGDIVELVVSNPPKIRACGTCIHRIGEYSKPNTWMCDVHGYTVETERKGPYEDAESCGPDGDWWEPRPKMETEKVAVENAQKSKGVKWAEKRLGHPLRQNEHAEYLVCEDELDRIVRSPFRSLFVFLASALATATFTSILRWLGS